MAEFVGPTIEVGKCIAGPIKRQFNYLCCFNNNIQKLRDEAKKLNDAKDGVEGQVDAARRNVQVIVPQVVTWIEHVNNIQANMSAIETEIGNVESDCLAIKSRFSLSRKATKMAAAMKLLQEDGKFGEICHPALPAAMTPIPLGQTYELESRKHFEEEIMATLSEKKVSMMGICGMGGLGKTVMAKKIMSRAREEGLFDEIVMAVVSQPVDISRIQREMAEFLGLKLEVEGILARAHQLRSRLMNAKSILIILDDLWETLNLEDLGIPDQRELKECTILLTSRSSDVFDAMNVEKTFQMKILEDEEARSLFKEKVGACSDDPNLFPLAQKIVRECQGLPIALVTVGAALKNKTLKYVWENAVHNLRSGNPKGIPKFLAQVYNPLKLSYDLLENEHAGLIFLMCCLFPEDHEIRISDLGFYAWGLGMFEGIGSLQDAWNEVQTLVQMLKTRSLLLDGDEDGYTKMHDVVRDVGIFIAAEKRLIDPNVSWKSWTGEESNYSIDCTWISLFSADKMTLHGGSVFPNLRFLLIVGSVENELKLSDNFFERARKLNVLSITNYILRSQPHNIQLQKNLRTLILKDCNTLVDISVVGELVSLEILYFYGCESIEELPIEIGRLNQLKLLHIEYCQNLKTIAAGVISRLIILEELTLIDSFSGWESGASEGENAGLCELNSLSRLTTLRIEIEDASLAAEEIHLSSNLVQFDVQIGTSDYRARSHGREMNLRLEGEVVIGDWIHQLVRSTECLDLQGESSGKLVPLLPELQSLKQLELENLKIVGVRSSSTAAIFPLLEVLYLFGIDDLEEINLGNDFLLRLKRLSIRSCSMLEQVALWNEEENIQSITFPKLKKLVLNNLPRLTSFCRGVQNIEFPQLTKMEIERCPNMKSLVSSGAMKHDDDSLHIFWKSKAAFGSRLKELRIKGISSVISRLWCAQISMDFFTGLVELTVSECGNIKSLFSPTVANNLVNLKRIEIEFCPMFEQVVLWNEEENEQSSCNHRSVTFPKLERLDANNLPKLTSFCKGIQSIEFPLLARMDIVECPNLKSLVSTTENDFKKCSDDDSLHLFCKPNEAAFCSRLKELRIEGISSVISRLWCAQISMDFFTGLVELTVSNCGNIKSLFSPTIANNLVNLNRIKIKSCWMLEQVVLWNEEENGQSSCNHRSVTFPKLEELYINDLPKLTSFCKGIQSIEFPLLTRMNIVECPNLRSLVSTMENDFKKCSDDDSLHLFCKPDEAALGRLNQLEIDGYECISRSQSLWCDQIPIDFFTRLVNLSLYNCGNIKSMFSASIAGNLVNLRDLTIIRCGEMVKVIEDEEALESSPFTKLETLRLFNLPKLKAFCDWRFALQLPSLWSVYIWECPEMERFSFGSLTTPNLEKISINWKDISDYTKDLNDALSGRRRRRVERRGRGRGRGDVVVLRRRNKSWGF